MARFFKLPIHYQDNRKIYSLSGTTRTDAPQVNDNDYRTSSTENSYIVQTHGETVTSNTTVDWLFVKGSNIDSYSLSVPSGKGTGNGFASKSIPRTVNTFEGTQTFTEINDIQHDLVDLSSAGVVVSNANLSASTATATNNLSAITTAIPVRVALSNVVLTDTETAGTVEIVGENPASTTVQQTLSFANSIRHTPQSTTQTYITITGINLTGFSSGTLTITYDSRLSCTEAQLVFTGTNVTIYEIMLLEHLLYFPPNESFNFIQHDLNHNSILKTSISGQNYRIRNLSSRPKWNSRYRAEFRSSSPVNYNQFSDLVYNNNNFVFSQEYGRYPSRVYPATWSDAGFNQQYRSRTISNGTDVEFSVQER